MFSELVWGEGPGRICPEQSWHTCLKDDFSTRSESQKSYWTEAAKDKGGVTWRMGVLEGAEELLAEGRGGGCR